MEGLKKQSIFSRSNLGSKRSNFRFFNNRMTFDLQFDLERMSFITIHLPKKLSIDPNFSVVEDLRNVLCFFKVKSADEKRKKRAF